jgi:hypothetical protein
MPAVYYSINNIFNQKPVPVIVRKIISEKKLNSFAVWKKCHNFAITIIVLLTTRDIDVRIYE